MTFMMTFSKIIVLVCTIFRDELTAFDTCIKLVIISVIEDILYICHKWSKCNSLQQPQQLQWVDRLKIAHIRMMQL